MLPTDARPTEVHTLHFDLAHVDGSYDFAMHISLQSYPLQRHDKASRARARTALPFLRCVPDAHLTHYIEDIALPSDAIALIHVTRPMQVGPEVADHLVHMGIHVPAAGHAAAAALARARSVQLWDVHPKLARFGITADNSTIDPQFPDGINDWQDAVDAATALLFHHPSLVNLNTNQGGMVPSTILNWITNALTSTGDLPEAILSAGDSWNVTVPAPCAPSPCAGTCPCAG